MIIKAENILLDTVQKWTSWKFINSN